MILTDAERPDVVVAVTIAAVDVEGKAMSVWSRPRGQSTVCLATVRPDISVIVTVSLSPGRADGQTTLTPVAVATIIGAPSAAVSGAVISPMLDVRLLPKLFLYGSPRCMGRDTSDLQPCSSTT